jgi:hypothetical protein
MKTLTKMVGGVCDGRTHYIDHNCPVYDVPIYPSPRVHAHPKSIPVKNASFNIERYTRRYIYGLEYGKVVYGLDSISDEDILDMAK